MFQFHFVERTVFGRSTDDDALYSPRTDTDTDTDTVINVCDCPFSFSVSLLL